LIIFIIWLRLIDIFDISQPQLSAYDSYARDITRQPMMRVFAADIYDRHFRAHFIATDFRIILADIELIYASRC